MFKPLVVLVAASALFACERPCARQDLERVISLCRVEPAAPLRDGCFAAGLRADPQHDFNRDAVDRCTAWGASDFFACLAANAELCRTQSLEAALAACSGRSDGAHPEVPSSSCQACADDGARCMSACPTTAWATCSSCSQACQLRAITCERGCGPL